MGSRALNKTTLYKAAMIVFDAIAVVFSYWFALIARFYIGFQFRAGADQFLTTLWKVMPFYATACIVVF